MIPWWAQFESCLAVAAPAEGSVRELVTYDLRRLAQFDNPRAFWGILAGIVVLLLVYVLWFYRREQNPLPLMLKGLLPGLRLLALAGAVLFFLGLEKRVDQQVTTDSEVLLLVDTSQSMSVEDEANGEGGKAARSQAVVQSLTSSDLIANLQRRHHVAVLSFDQQAKRLKAWPRLKTEPPDEISSMQQEDSPNTQTNEADWTEFLEPTGIETRIGDALRDALQPTSSRPLAGVILMSDGGQNLGVEPLSLLESVDEATVPIFTVGVGSTEPRRNVRVLEMNAPARLYPKDKATVSGLIRGEDFVGRSVVVELLLKPAGIGGSAVPVGQQRVTFEEDGQSVPVQFEIEPAEIGRLQVEMRIQAPAEDQYAEDNSRVAEVEVVATKTKVLLLASGATRDYRFLRDQLRRDRYATVDVLLQNALPGISQGADKIVEEFPRTKEVLYNYDCIVAFDPDWSQLDVEQAELLESWVAEEAGD